MTKEWNARIRMWIQALKKHLYQPIGTMQFTYCTTFDHWSYDQALEAPFLPIQEGDRWGSEWEYGWFQTSFKLDDRAKGKRVVMDLNLGGEATLFVNGEVWGTRRADWVSEPHHYLCDNYITRDSLGCEEIHLVVECYAGHDRPEESGIATAGPVPHGYAWHRDNRPNRAVVGKSTYGIWNEDVYHLLIEVQNLYEIWKNADPDSLRVTEIAEALQEFTMIVDFSLEENAFMESIRQCREYLKPILACTNGSTVPKMHAIGHAHIDLAWLWPLQETERKAARTMAAQLRHMDEYPEYKMLLSQPALYEMIREYYPSLFKRLKEKTTAGQLVPEGGMWVEADTNVPSGESLIRQFLYGKKYFREEFGVESEMLWLPDVFGYSAALPQIMNGCGIKYFATAKIFWAYNGGEPFPYHYFDWKGLDGSVTKSFLHNDYSSMTDAGALIKKWKERRHRPGLKRMLVAVGYGDGGGGATRDHIENVRLLNNCEGVPSIFYDHPSNLFQQLDSEYKDTPEYVGELYFQAHRGTYTSQAKNKKYNRLCEQQLREAEIWGTLANIENKLPYPKDSLEENWKTVLKNQFHDIIPGSSIHKVYKMSHKELEGVLESTQYQINSAVRALTADTEDALTVFNSLSWNRNVLVKLPHHWEGAKTADGRLLATQKTADGTYAQVNAPAFGCVSIYPAEQSNSTCNTVIKNNTMENSWIRVRFNDSGEITSLFDKDTETEWASGKLNEMVLYQDIPSHYEAWDIDSMRKAVAYKNTPANISITAQGPLFCEIKVEKNIGCSAFTQWIRLERDSRTVTFRTAVDWQETQKLLKVRFPVNIHTDELISEIQYGHVRRPNHRSRQIDQDRFEVCNHKWSALAEENRGFAVMNDCKYGISCIHNCMELTLLKSALFPDETADKGLQEFTYAITFWDTPLAESHVVNHAYELNIPATICSGVSPNGSFLTIDNPNIIVDCIKMAENTENAVVIRLYESIGSQSKGALRTRFPVVSCMECNMLEQPQQSRFCASDEITLELRPFEVKTIMLTFT